MKFFQKVVKSETYIFSILLIKMRPAYSDCDLSGLKHSAKKVDKQIEAMLAETQSQAHYPSRHRWQCGLNSASSVEPSKRTLEWWNTENLNV